MAKNKGFHKSEAWLRQRRIIERKTYQEMSDEAGVSSEMIRRSLNARGIK